MPTISPWQDRSFVVTPQVRRRSFKKQHLDDAPMLSMGIMDVRVHGLLMFETLTCNFTKIRKNTIPRWQFTPTEIRIGVSEERPPEPWSLRYMLGCTSARPIANIRGSPFAADINPNTCRFRVKGSGSSDIARRVIRMLKAHRSTAPPARLLRTVYNFESCL